MSDLLSQFQKHLNEDPSATLYCFADAKGKTNDTLSRGELDHKARCVASLLQQQGLKPGDRALLVYSFSLDVIPAFIGCFYAGVIPCPVSPPNPLDLKKDLPRFEDLAGDSGCKAILTNSEYARLRTLANIRSPLLTRNTLWKELPWLKTDGSLPKAKQEIHAAAQNDIAFIQYTSGSTSTPKGVMISFDNIEAQLTMSQQTCPVDQLSRLVAWIPYYHDHCLVGGILNVMYRGAVLHLLSPLTFLSNPAIWFDVLTRVKATGTAAPDFAFNYSVRKTTLEQRQQWDLSCIEVFQSGGEPIQAESVNRFFDTFAVSGLKPDTFSPGYGMAEHVLVITNKVGSCKQISIDRQQYERANRVVLSDGPESQKLVGNGHIPDGVDLKIVDPNSLQALADDDIGEIWVDSRSKALGYWNKPEVNETEFHARIAGEASNKGYLRTGDLGFIYNNELYIAGRIKDTIILRGRNIHPQDVEVVVTNAHEIIRPGRSIAFAHSIQGESEHLALIAEVKSKTLSHDQAREVADVLRHKITASLAVSCRTLIFVTANTISKTTSGKHQRLKTRNNFQSGALAKRVLWQDTLSEEESSSHSEKNLNTLTEANVLKRLVAHIAAIEVRSPNEIDVDAPLSNFALDSLAIMGLVLEMNSWTGKDVSHEDFLIASSLTEIAQTLVQAPATVEPDTLAVNPQQRQTEDATTNDQLYYPLNPSQAWMFEPDGADPHGWTIGGMLHAIEPLQVPLLQRALDCVVDCHEALRLRIEPTSEGLQQRIVPHDSIQVECVELYNLSGTALRYEVKRVIAERQRRMNYTTGPAIQLSVLQVDETEIERLLILVHHISVDAYSCELIVCDLIRTYEQLLHGQAVTLTRPGVSYGEWMNTLVAMASSAQIEASAEQFLNMPTVQPLLPDNPQGRNTDGKHRVESFTLSHLHSEKLLRHIPNETGLSTAMLLLTALGYALNDQLSQTNHRLELVHHGRKDAIDDYDLSRTCGWMSINCPVTLAMNAQLNPIEQAESIQATINELPRHGLDYSLLSFMHPDKATRNRIRAASRPEMKFMWFGQAQGRLQAFADKYPMAQETVGTSFEENRSAHYLQYFYGTVHNGCIRLDVSSSCECYHDVSRQAVLSLWQKHIESVIDYCATHNSN